MKGGSGKEHDIRPAGGLPWSETNLFRSFFYYYWFSKKDKLEYKGFSAVSKEEILR